MKTLIWQNDLLYYYYIVLQDGKLLTRGVRDKRDYCYNNDTFIEKIKEEIGNIELVYLF